jgi:cyclopropane fatty-acyl-phospholipid synthase-like methyltransferase
VTAADLADRARRYYDANTHRFLRYGQGGYAGAIHRSVWGPSVQSEREAFEYADSFVLERLTRLASGRALHVLDLGCGVGASLAYLATRLSMRGTGITISPVQAQLARERLAGTELAARIRILEGSYLDIPRDVGVADAAFSIEAFLHCPDPDRYFAEAAAHIPPGGLLMILDDFITERASGPLGAPDARVLREFNEGWVTAALKTTAQVAAYAARHGFTLTENVDFTPHLELRRPRDRLIARFVSVARHLPVRTEYLKNFLGGNALNQGLRSGLLEYRFLVFEKRA